MHIVHEVADMIYVHYTNAVSFFSEKCPAHKKNRRFTEGWVEFQDKSIAKVVARSLNNRQIGGKKRCPWHEELWNIKYLPKFRWGHLNERLAYEREVFKQRLRTEVAQAKKETGFYLQNVERSKLLEKAAKKRKRKANDDDDGDTEDAVDKKTTREWTFKQRRTEEEILSRKARTDSKDKSNRKQRGHKQGQMKKDLLAGRNAASNKSFLRNIFSGGLQASNEDS